MRKIRYRPIATKPEVAYDKDILRHMEKHGIKNIHYNYEVIKKFAEAFDCKIRKDFLYKHYVIGLPEMIVGSEMHKKFLAMCREYGVKPQVFGEKEIDE